MAWVWIMEYKNNKRHKHNINILVLNSEKLKQPLHTLKSKPHTFFQGERKKITN